MICKLEFSGQEAPADTAATPVRIGLCGHAQAEIGICSLIIRSFSPVVKTKVYFVSLPGKLLP